jgi:hypothetical protein
VASITVLFADGKIGVKYNEMRILIKAKMIAKVKIEICDALWGDCGGCELWGGSEGCDKVCVLMVRRDAISGA